MHLAPSICASIPAEIDMADGSEAADHFVLICAKCCDGETALKLRAALKDELPEGFALRAVNCMAGCDYPATVGLHADGKATYLFGEINGPDEVAGILAFSHQYKQSTNGWTSATERPAVLYNKTLARIPALKTARQ